MEKSVYSLLLIDKHATIFKKNGQGWVNECISGESWHSLSSSSELVQLITKFNRKVNSDFQLNNMVLTVIYDNDFSEKISDLASILHEFKCEEWQLISYAMLAKHAQAKDGYQSFSSLDQSWIITVLLPVLYNRHHTYLISEELGNRDNQERKIGCHEEKEKRLSEELNKLRLQIQSLKLQVNIQHKLDLEQLFCFLPLFYKDVWTIINPEQIALLSGNLITQINIKSPYREPDKSTLLVLKKQFVRLSNQQQTNIIDFCLRIEHPLEVRREMQSFLEEI